MTLEDLKAKFEALYENKDSTEQDFQEYLQEHSELIPRTFEQNHGIHLDTVFVKVPIGNYYKSDFMYISKSSVDWHVVHIEIEDPRKTIFTKKGVPTSEFNAAAAQVRDWIGWFQAPESLITFNQEIEMIRKPEHMASNPVEHKFILVYGRREELNSPQKKAAFRTLQIPSKFNIMTYDSLFEASHPVLHIGKISSRCVQIDHRKEIDEWFFSFLNPSQFSIPKSEKDRLVNRLETRRYSDLGRRMAGEADNRTLENLKKVNTH